MQPDLRTSQASVKVRPSFLNSSEKCFPGMTVPPFPRQSRSMSSAISIFTALTDIVGIMPTAIRRVNTAKGLKRCDLAKFPLTAHAAPCILG